jgi:hypothetical protein
MIVGIISRAYGKDEPLRLGMPAITGPVASIRERLIPMDFTPPIRLRWNAMESQSFDEIPPSRTVIE